MPPARVHTNQATSREVASNREHGTEHGLLRYTLPHQAGAVQKRLREGEKVEPGALSAVREEFVLASIVCVRPAKVIATRRSSRGVAPA